MEQNLKYSSTSAHFSNYLKNSLRSGIKTLHSHCELYFITIHLVSTIGRGGHFSVLLRLDYLHFYTSNIHSTQETFNRKYIILQKERNKKWSHIIIKMQKSLKKIHASLKSSFIFHISWRFKKKKECLRDLFFLYCKWKVKLNKKLFGKCWINHNM